MDIAAGQDDGRGAQMAMGAVDAAKGQVDHQIDLEKGITAGLRSGQAGVYTDTAGRRIAVSDGEHYAHRSVALLDLGAVEYKQGLALKRVSDDTKVWHEEARRRYELQWKPLLTEHFVGRCSDSRDEDLMEAEGSQATSAAAARVAPTRAAALERRWLAGGSERSQ